MTFNKLLYIEDDDDIRMVVSLLLKKQGIEVSEFANGTDGLEGAKQFDADAQDTCGLCEERYT